MLDRFIAFILLLLFLPLILILMLCVYIEDGNPVMLAQYRVGQHGKWFRFYKIRTMKLNTPHVASNDLNDADQYILKTGKFFRKYSLDEIHNILNIVSGDMRFIGPRPLLPTEENIQELRRKYSITLLKPGITGWAQVNGRDIVSDERKVVLERYYLRNRSTGLNLKILWRTVVGVLRASGVKF